MNRANSNEYTVNRRNEFRTSELYREASRKMKGGTEMIVTTTANVDGKKIIEYKGIVFGEVVSGVNVLKDFTAGMRNFFGGRSAGDPGRDPEAKS